MHANANPAHNTEAAGGAGAPRPVPQRPALAECADRAGETLTLEQRLKMAHALYNDHSDWLLWDAAREEWYKAPTPKSKMN